MYIYIYIYIHRYIYIYVNIIICIYLIHLCVSVHTSATIFIAWQSTIATKQLMFWRRPKRGVLVVMPKIHAVVTLLNKHNKRSYPPRIPGMELKSVKIRYLEVV